MLVPLYVFPCFRVSQKRNTKRSPNRMKLLWWFFLDQKTPRRLGVQVRRATRWRQGQRACPGGRARPHPCGPLVTPPTYFFRLYILIYSITNRESHENTFPPPQPSVPMRSHWGTFSGILPEGDSIMEGFYIKTIASSMKREKFTSDLWVHS